MSETASRTGDYPVNEEDKTIQKEIKCSCSKTKCRKNYCECFKAGQPCGAACGCISCSNTEESACHPKKKKQKRATASGCKCQKSQCLKNYCECHQEGRKCGRECRCVDCHNGLEFDTAEESLEEFSGTHRKVHPEPELKFLRLVMQPSNFSRILWLILLYFTLLCFLQKEYFAFCFSKKLLFFVSTEIPFKVKRQNKCSDFSE